METKNIFSVIAEGIGNTNQNVVEVFNLMQENNRLLMEIHSILFPKDLTAEPTSDGTATNDK
jgi:hypothetical protein